MLTGEQLQLISQWQDIAIEAKRLGAIEMELRKQIAALLVPAGTVGIHRFTLGNEPAKIKIVLGETSKLDKDAGGKLGNVYAKLLEKGLTQDEANGLIKTELILSTGAYNKLSAMHQTIMAEVVTTKPSTPTIEIEREKEKK